MFTNQALDLMVLVGLPGKVKIKKVHHKSQIKQKGQ
jgi:hypothetical protein